VLNNALKCHAFTPASVHSSASSQISQEKTPNKIIKRRAIEGKEKSPWRVLTSSPIMQKKKLNAKRRKYNFKKTAHSPNSSNPDKNDDSDCCK
jgi:ribosomal silencing factor RsfS